MNHGDVVLFARTGTYHAVSAVEHVDGWTACGRQFRVDDSQIVRQRRTALVTCGSCVRVGVPA